MFLEGHGVAKAQRLDKPVHEFLGRQVDNVSAGILFTDMPGDSMHQMRLAKPHPAIKEQRVKGDRGRFGGAARNSECQLVRLANDEIRKGIARIKASSDRITLTSRRVSCDSSLLGGLLLRHAWGLLL